MGLLNLRLLEVAEEAKAQSSSTPPEYVYTMSNISQLQSEDPEGWSKGLDDLLKEAAADSTMNRTNSNEKKSHRGRAKGTTSEPLAVATSTKKEQPLPRNTSMPDNNRTSLLSLDDFPERYTPIKFNEERIPLMQPSKSYNANYNSGGSSSSLRHLPNNNEQAEEAYNNPLRRRFSDTNLRQKVSFHGSVKLTTHNELGSFRYDSGEGGGDNDESIFPTFHHHWLPDLYEIEDDTTTAVVLSSPPPGIRSRKSKHYQQHKRPPPTKRSMRRRMFLFLTEPATSIGSAVFFLFLFVAISVMNLVMIMQTMNRWQYTPTDCITCGG